VNTLVKSPEQVEIAEIIERLETEQGLSKAEIARQLDIERAYVTMLAKGQRTPPPRTLNQMRALEGRLKGRPESGPAPENTPELNRLYEKLALMERFDKANFDAVKRVIEALPAPSSTAASASARLLKKASAALHRPGGGPQS